MYRYQIGGLLQNILIVGSQKLEEALCQIKYLQAGHVEATLVQTTLVNIVGAGILDQIQGYRQLKPIDYGRKENNCVTFFQSFTQDCIDIASYTYIFFLENGHLQIEAEYANMDENTLGK